MKQVTEEMIEAGCNAAPGWLPGETVAAIYLAMQSAQSTPPVDDPFAGAGKPITPPPVTAEVKRTTEAMRLAMEAHLDWVCDTADLDVLARAAIAATRDNGREGMDDLLRAIRVSIELSGREELLAFLPSIDAALKEGDSREG